MGMALCVLASPMPALAAESSVLMASGGIASVLETERSLEEYLQIAQDAQGASWGYTNIGVANVESGNLNIRAMLHVKSSRRRTAGAISSPVKWKAM